MVGILIRIGAALALAAALAWGWHLFTGHYRDQGRAEIQAEWDKDRAMRIARTSEIVVTLSGKLMEAKDEASKLQRGHEAIFAVLDEAVRAIPAGSTVSLPAASARVLNDAADAAIAATTAPDGGGKSAAVALPQATATYSEQEFAEYLKDAPRAYTSAFDKWAACRVREDLCRAALNEGIP
jgi:hypothetical protein